MIWKINNSEAAVMFGASSSICLKQFAASLIRSHVLPVSKNNWSKFMLITYTSHSPMTADQELEIQNKYI